MNVEVTFLRFFCFFWLVPFLREESSEESWSLPDAGVSVLRLRVRRRSAADHWRTHQEAFFPFFDAGFLSGLLSSGCLALVLESCRLIAVAGV